MASDLRTLMRPFATAIHAKARALKDVAMTDAHQSRLRESISDDIKKASNFHPHRMSVAARRRALEMKVEDLALKTWHDQHSFDRGRQTFIVEHMTPVSMLREKCLRAGEVSDVLAVLANEIRVVWILRTEDDKLTTMGYRSKRPPTAYKEAGIEIWERD